MARVIAGMTTSLDGFVADESGSAARLEDKPQLSRLAVAGVPHPPISSVSTIFGPVCAKSAPKGPLQAAEKPYGAQSGPR